jgi:hypothetical protein
MIEESLGILDLDNIMPLTEQQQELFKDWDWLNPATQLVNSQLVCLTSQAPSPQQLDVAFLKKHHQFPLGLQVYLIKDNEDIQSARCSGQGKVIFALDELPIGTSFLSPHGAVIRRTRSNTVKVMDTEILI